MPNDVFSGVQNFTANPDLLNIRLEWDAKMIGELQQQNKDQSALVAILKEVANDQETVSKLENLLTVQDEYLDDFAQSVAEHKSQITGGVEDNPTV